MAFSNIAKMLLTVFIVKIIIFVHGGFCDDLLTKFHQTDYMIRNLRSEVVYFNQELMHSFTLIGHKYNRTTTAFNCTFQTKIDVKDKVEIVVQYYKRASNEYRLFPARFQLNLCKVIDSNVIGLKAIPNYGNFPVCFWKKGVQYFAYNFCIDQSHLPPFIPHGEYKSEITLLYLEDQLSVVNGYAEVYSRAIGK